MPRRQSDGSIAPGRVSRALSGLVNSFGHTNQPLTPEQQHELDRSGRSYTPTKDSNGSLEMGEVSYNAPSPTVLEDAGRKRTSVGERWTDRGSDIARAEVSHGITRKGQSSKDPLSPRRTPSQAGIKVVLVDHVEAALLAPGTSGPSAVMDGLYSANFCVAVSDDAVMGLVSYRQSREPGDRYTMDYGSLLRLLRAAREVGADAIWSANTPCPPLLPCRIPPRMRSHADHHPPGSTSGATSSRATRTTTTTSSSTSRRWRAAWTPSSG